MHDDIQIPQKLFKSIHSMGGEKFDKIDKCIAIVKKKSSAGVS